MLMVMVVDKPEGQQDNASEIIVIYHLLLQLLGRLQGNGVLRLLNRFPDDNRFLL